MSEIAFTVMDLRDRGRPDLAQRFLNAYLETTGDYAGLAVLRFYLVYRALVRAKIARLRAAQLGAGDAQNALLADYRGYVALAGSYARPPRRALVVTHGLAGCGKTTASQALLETIGGVRIRSDVERKRMHGLTALDRSGAGRDLYAPAASEATYDRLRALAQHVVGAGWTAIVDATFLHRSQREPFRALATKLEVPFVILDFQADEATLRQRVVQRHAGGSDASDADLAVLAHQIATREPLTPEERRYAITYDAEAALDGDSVSETWARVQARLSYR
jgi:hypothetical protein